MTDHLNLVEPEVIVPQEVINIPDFIGKEDVDLSCYSVRNLPNGGRFSSPGWDGKLTFELMFLNLKKSDEYLYSNNLNCTWTVGRPGCMTEIDFYEIDIEDLHLLRKCPYDRLLIQTCKWKRGLYAFFGGAHSDLSKAARFRIYRVWSERGFSVCLAFNSF